MGSVKGDGLTVKEQRFVDEFFGAAKGNLTQAALNAGYGTTRKSASTLSARLLGKVGVQQAIAARLQQQRTSAILSAEERDAMLSRIAKRTAIANPKEAISAIKELNKCTGRHSIKHIHDGRLTLEQVLGDSRS